MNANRFRVNAFFGHYYADLTPDSDPEEITNVFTSGNCHSLAIALHKLTGWTLCGSFYESDVDDGLPCHVFVQNDRGNYVDIEGEKTPAQFRKRWTGEIKPITLKDVRSWVRARNEGKIGYIPIRVKASKPFAEKLINHIGGLKWQR